MSTKIHHAAIIWTDFYYQNLRYYNKLKAVDKERYVNSR